jgi:hypothetical protein
MNLYCDGPTTSLLHNVLHFAFQDFFVDNDSNGVNGWSVVSRPVIGMLSQDDDVSRLIAAVRLLAVST